MSKKLQQKQERRRAEELRRSAQKKAQRRTNLITVGAAVLVGALVVGAILWQKGQEEAGIPKNVGVAADAAGCGDVEEFEEQKADHIEIGAAHEPYSSDPPTSGPHYGTPADEGFYSDPLPVEQVVHNLEHGQIVIYYNPAADDETRTQIEGLTEQEPLATVAIPYDGITDPNMIVLAAWGSSQTCEKVSQEVVDDFRAEFQGKGPEQVGVPTFEKD